MMKLMPRKPLRAWTWQKKDCCTLRAVGIEIRPKVDQSGQVEYYLNGEWLQDGAVIVEIAACEFRLMTQERVDQIYDGGGAE